YRVQDTGKTMTNNHADGVLSSVAPAGPDLASLHVMIDSLAPRIFAGLLDASGSVIYLSRHALGGAAMDIGEAIGRSLLSLPIWQLCHRSRRQMKAGLMQAMRGVHSRFDVQATVKAGVVRVLDFSLQPVIDGQGSVLYMIASAFDVTPHKDITRTLQMVRFATDRVSDMVVQVGGNGCVAYVNDTACRHSGYSRDQLLGMPVRKLFPEFETRHWSWFCD